jgi:hypothetical protein
VGPSFGSYRGMYYPDDIKSWLESNLGIEKVNLGIDLLDPRYDLIVVTPEWIRHNKFHLKFFIPIFGYVLKMRKTKRPVFGIIGDIYKIEYLIPISILVSGCGGSIPLNSITINEAVNFGIPFPSGPYVMQLNQKNIKLFQSSHSWAQRSNTIIFGSGSLRREQIFKDLNPILGALGWTTIITRRQLEWEDYRLLIKKSKVLICASTLIESASERLRFKFLSKRLAKYAITHRIWEGFCGGLLVVTDVTPTLTELGFIKGIHFLDLQELITSNATLPDETEMSRIAKAGNTLFKNIVFSDI